MSEEACNHADDVCAHEQSLQLPPLKLAKVQERFAREAVWRSFDTGRYRCRYFEWGSGPPLVFVHGLCDDALSFVMPIARLTHQFRCIAYDLADGDGDGCHLPRYHHAGFVNDFLALLDHVQLEQTYAFGSSFGSTISLKAAERQPRRFPRLILQGGFARRPLTTPERYLSLLGRYWPWPMKYLPLRCEFMRQTQFLHFDGREPAVWEYFLLRSGLPPMKAVARRALIVEQLDLRAMLRHICQPVLLICGDQDGIVGKDCEQMLLENLPNCVRVEIERCGHLPQFSHPEVLAEIVRRFLQSDMQNGVLGHAPA